MKRTNKMFPVTWPKAPVTWGWYEFECDPPVRGGRAGRRQRYKRRQWAEAWLPRYAEAHANAMSRVLEQWRCNYPAVRDELAERFKGLSAR